MKEKRKKNSEMTTKYHRLWKYFPDAKSGRRKKWKGEDETESIKRFKELSRILSFKDYEKEGKKN